MGLRTQTQNAAFFERKGPKRKPLAPKEVFKSQTIRKILVSVKFVSAILGPEMAAPVLWTPEKMRSFCRKTYVNKIPRFKGGGILGLRGGEVPILFLWARGSFWNNDRNAFFERQRFRTQGPKSQPFLGLSIREPPP